MYHPAALFIGFRYMRGRAVNYFSRLIFYLSTMGIVIGVMSLVTALSVMNGFEYELKNNILELMPQVIISSTSSSLNPKKIPKNAIKVHGISSITPLTIGDVVLQSAHGISTGIILGIDPAQKDPLTPYLIDVNPDDLREGQYNIILGQKLSRELSIGLGDQLRIIVPSINQFTPIGRFPNQRLFKVIGTFSTNSEIDSYQILANIQDISRLMNLPPGDITGWRLQLNEPLRVSELSHQKLPDGTKWQDWREQKGELFQAVRMEKNVMRLLLSLIIAIAGFNIMTSLGLMVIEKKREVAILQTQGMMPHQIMIIFIFQGTSSGTIGAFIGSILGIMFTGQLNKLIPIEEILDARLPVEIRPLQIIGIVLIAIIIAFIATLYPSWRAASLKPTEVLRHE